MSQNLDSGVEVGVIWALAMEYIALQHIFGKSTQDTSYTAPESETVYSKVSADRTVDRAALIEAKSPETETCILCFGQGLVSDWRISLSWL